MPGISNSCAREIKHIYLEVEESCSNVIRGKKTTLSIYYVPAVVLSVLGISMCFIIKASL